MSVVAYQALFREGPWDGRQIMVTLPELQWEITVLEEDPEITELLAELQVADPDPKAFEYALIGFVPAINAYLYLPKNRIRPGG